MADQLLDKIQEQDVSELLPPEGDPKLGKRVFTLLAEIINDKISLGLHDKWSEYYKLGRNQMFKRQNSSVPLVSANLLHTHRQRTVNMLTDNNPAFNVMAMVHPDEQVNETVLSVQRQCEYWWIEQEQQSLFEESVRAGETNGTTIEKVLFDPDLEYGLGEVRTICIDPFHFGVYPVKAKAIQDSEGVLYFFPMSLREARRRWPDKASEIKADSELLEKLGDDRRELITGSSMDGFFAKIGSTIMSLFATAGVPNKTRDELLVVEAWVKDYSTIADKETGNIRAKYPGNIRCVIACNGGKIILKDKPNPSMNPMLSPEEQAKTYLFDKFPFSKANSITDPVSFWGASDFEQLQQLNKEFNKAISQLVFLKDKSARPKIINPRDSGVPNEQFDNAPGIINPTSMAVATGIRYLDFPNVPMDVEKVAGLLKDIFYIVSGSFELEQAQTPGREVTAYKAIAALLERAATMMRGKIRNYSRLLRDRGRMYLSHAQNWYTEERWFTWEDGNGQIQAGSLRNTDILFPLKLTIINGSTLPTSQIQQREEAMELFKGGAIDQQDLLEKLNWSGRDELIKRMKEGPFGELFRRAEMMGLPPEITQALAQIATLDQKQFEQAAKRGELPMLQLPAPEAPADDPLKNMELALAGAKVETEKANQALTIERANTERMQQWVHEKGVEFDTQKLAIERAQALANIEATKHGMAMKEREPKEPVPEDKQHEGARERGLRSNNQKPSKAPAETPEFQPENTAQ